MGEDGGGRGKTGEDGGGKGRTGEDGGEKGEDGGGKGGFFSSISLRHAERRGSRIFLLVHQFPSCYISRVLSLPNNTSPLVFIWRRVFFSLPHRTAATRTKYVLV